ncbi:MAG: hypothetical protein FJ276_01110 [Planctomycetes bacterium]|nr:hypothetical protein [Planctomycetota bacterium]
MRLFPNRVGRLLARREERATVHIDGLFTRLQTCRSRREYEAVLGKPAYIISGKGFGKLGRDGNVRDEPDLIEHYECGDCCIELSFKDDRIREKCGTLRLTQLYVAFHR